jgi:hypothetical protein
MNDRFSYDRGVPVPVVRVLRDLIHHPIETIARRWNWKSALLSSIVRGLIFFCVNLVAGWHAAVAALLTELTFRGVASGFYGALTEAFRFAEPEWAASLAVVILLPLVGHSLEFAVHLLRGTAKLGASIFASVCFTAVSTLFNLYAMRRGALVTGEGGQSLGADVKMMPRLVLSFLAAGPLAAWRFLGSRLNSMGRPQISIDPAPQESPD